MDPNINNIINGLKYIDFIFNYTSKTFKLSLEYIFNKNNNDGKELKTIIKEECLKNDIILTEDNIVLYDYENDYIINRIEDLTLHKTKICTIMIIPVKCNNHF